MVIRYTYLLKNKTTGLFYYGVKYGVNSNPEIFWIDYFTSSNHVKRLIEKYGKDDFEFEIRKVGFKTSKEAREYESKVIRRLKAVERNDFLNKFDGSTEWYNSGGYNIPEDAKEKHSKSKRNTKLINNGFETKRIKSSELDTYLKLGWQQGFHADPQINHRGKIKIRKDNEIKSINEYELEFYINDGWAKGDGNTSIKGMTCITNGSINKYLHKDSIEDFLKNNKDFYIGSFTPTSLNRKAINKFSEVKYINIDDLQKYLNDGWNLGTGRSYSNPNPKSGYKHEAIVCPHCYTKGGAGVMRRWHFDRCRSKNNV